MTGARAHYFERADGSRFHFKAPNALVARRLAEQRSPGARYRGFKTNGRLNGGDAARPAEVTT